MTNYKYKNYKFINLINNIICNKYMESTKTYDEHRVQNLYDMANKLRIHSIEMTDLSSSG